MKRTISRLPVSNPFPTLDEIVAPEPATMKVFSNILMKQEKTKNGFKSKNRSHKKP